MIQYVIIIINDLFICNAHGIIRWLYIVEKWLEFGRIWRKPVRKRHVDQSSFVLVANHLQDVITRNNDINGPADRISFIKFIQRCEYREEQSEKLITGKRIHFYYYYGHNNYGYWHTLFKILQILGKSWWLQYDIFKWLQCGICSLGM